MLIDMSGRTDIVSVYSEWMFRRFEEGFVYSRNTICPNSVRRYELTPDKVDCLLFCSKNFIPVLDRINKITDTFHSYFYYTITAYGKDIEPRVPDIETSIQALYELERVVKPGGEIIIPTYINMSKGTGTAAVKFITLLGADFKRQFDLDSYKAFFEDKGYNGVEYHVVDGRMPCAIAVITKA